MNISTDKIADVRKTPVYVVSEGEMLIDAPVSKVWRHVIDYPSWQNYSIVRHIEGEAGREGELVLLKKEEAGVQSTPYYARTIMLDGERRVIWKTFRDGVEYFGIVEFRVDEVQGRTRFRYNVLYEHVVEHRDRSELESFRERQHGNVNALFSTILPKLKKLAEGG